jgi:hypothetical protein
MSLSGCLLRFVDEVAIFDTSLKRLKAQTQTQATQNVYVATAP